MPMTSVFRSHHAASRIAVGISVLAIAAGMTGCSAVDEYKRATSDAWAVTYELSVTGGESKELKDISFLDSEERGGESVEVTGGLGMAQPDEDKKDTYVFTVDAMITAEKDAGISATPAKDVTATCRVLLDGVKEIASETGKPGEAVNCSVTTPAFSK